MINLAGNEEADEQIQEELYLAVIEPVRGEKSRGEVPYSITGKLGDWKFARAWYYWMASASGGKGLPLEVAAQMHEKKYPIIGERQPKNYGQVIRVAGHCGCPHPREWAKHFDEEGKQLILDPTHKYEKQFDVLLEQKAVLACSKLVNDLRTIKFNTRYVPTLDGVVAKSVVDSYHIDEQLGLNEFARVLRELQ